MVLILAIRTKFGTETCNNKVFICMHACYYNCIANTFCIGCCRYCSHSGAAGTHYSAHCIVKEDRHLYTDYQGGQQVSHSLYTISK